MKNQKAKEYSLWLMPTGEVYNKLATLISQLSKEYSAPNFEPHITLLGPIVGPEEKIIAKTSQLTKFIQPYKINLTIVNSYPDEYYKRLFIRAKETKDVINANIKARKIFGQHIVGQPPDTKYMPHLSLLYGNFSPQMKEEIISKIGKEFNIGFEVKSIYLFLTDGEVKNWHKVKEFILEPNSF